jgi:hypothetical protein
MPFETTCSFHARNVQMCFFRKLQLVMYCAHEYLLQKFLHKMVQAILINSVRILLRLGRVTNVPHKSNQCYCMTVIHPNQIINGLNNLLSPLGHNTQLPGRPHLAECCKSHISCFKSNRNQSVPLQQEPTWIHTKPWLIIFHYVGARVLRWRCRICIIGRHSRTLLIVFYVSVIVGCSTFYVCMRLASFGWRSTFEASFGRSVLVCFWLPNFLFQTTVATNSSCCLM